MDTRKKIVALDELRTLANGKPIRWVGGRFDLLLADHARRLEELRTPGACLAVVIRDSRQALLPPRARAELVAALSSVDFVVLDAGQIAFEDLDDACISQQFSGHVRRRHRGEED